MNTTGGTGTKPSQPVDDARQFMLRPMEKSDLDTIANWYLQVEDVSIFDRQIPVPINREEVAKIIDNIVSDREKEKCVWYVAEDEEENAVGMCGLESINMLHGNAILPVFVASKQRRSGIGIRMACLMLDIAFHQLRLHRVMTVYRVDNQASRALIKRCGFQQEGIAREAWFSLGEHFDLINVGILAEEWEQGRVALRKTMNPAVRAALGPRASDEWIWP